MNKSIRYAIGAVAMAGALGAQAANAAFTLNVSGANGTVSSSETKSGVKLSGSLTDYSDTFLTHTGGKINATESSTAKHYTVSLTVRCKNVIDGTVSAMGWKTAAAGVTGSSAGDHDIVCGVGTVVSSAASTLALL
jgi:hypothetical protein